MAWSAPATRSTGDLITASIWNTDLKANLDYLKTEADKAILEDGTNAFTADQPMGTNKLTGLAAGSAAGHSVRYEQLYTVSQTDQTASRALSTIYQNTSGKIRLVTIWVAYNSVAGVVDFRCDANATPTLVLKQISIGAATEDARDGGTFVVPLSYYYRLILVPGCDATIGKWVEYDFN